jgi:PGAP1-like protein
MFRRVHAGRVLLFVTALLVSAAAPKALDAGYVSHQAERKAVIVFVHGVFGDADSTWSGQGFPWPKALTSDSFFSEFNIYTYAYPSPYAAKTYLPSEIADILFAQLNSDGVLDHPQIVIVAHSMGGLVARKMLLRYRDRLIDKVKLIVFYATPTQGSPVAKIASVLSSNPQLGKMFPIDGKTDSQLFQEQVDWLAAKVHIPSYCAYELRDTYGVRIVPPESAIQLCNAPVMPIDDDHIGIVKPRGADSVPYVVLKSALKDAGYGPQMASGVDTFRKVWHSTGPEQTTDIELDLSRPLYLQVQLFKGDAVNFGGLNGLKRVRLGGAWIDFVPDREYKVEGAQTERVVPEFQPKVEGKITVQIRSGDQAPWPRRLDAPIKLPCGGTVPPHLCKKS